MTPMMTLTPQRLSVPAFVLLLAAASAPAAAEDGGMFVSANLGVTLSTYSRNDLNKALDNAFEDGLTVDSSAVEKPKAPWWAGVGYMVSPYFGVAATYLDLQTLKYQAAGTQSSPATSSLPVDAQLHITSRGPTVTVLGALPLWNAWQLTGQAGVYVGKTTSNYVSHVGTTKNVGSESASAASLLLGVGGAYAFGGHYAVHLDYLYANGLHEKVLDNSFNVSVLTAGITYAF
jgi:opacity protein-like surface antigen